MTPNGTDDTDLDDVIVEDDGAAAAPPADPLAEVVADLEQRLAQAQEKLADTEGRLRKVSKAFMDQKAEMSAFRERTASLESSKLARREFEVVQVFFDPVQNLQRSIETGLTDPDAFLAGISMIHQQFAEGLRKLGLDAVPGVGATFDPNLHEALAVAPVGDAASDGKVLVVHEDGFMVNGRAVQPAKVVVGRYTPGAEEPSA
ncbi:MAG: nucleotide exchange factor GrpE [Alphaproteobacteria bacterium]|nr:nucleotide exchange factor GrpE [Alphaproteobacteria bacterium]